MDQRATETTLDTTLAGPAAKTMQYRRLWLALAIFGTIFPNYFFMVQYVTSGFDFVVACQLATANWIARGVTADVLTASAMLWVYAGFELQRKGELHKLWVYVVLALGFGLSCALPVFFWRHGRLD